MLLFAPALTIAELATIWPSGERAVHTFGRGSPAGHTVTEPTPPPLGITVTFTTKAFAVVGMLQTFDAGMLSVRVSVAFKVGGANAPVRPSKLYSDRVSITRHGGNGTNRRPAAAVAAKLLFALSPASPVMLALSGLNE